MIRPIVLVAVAVLLAWLVVTHSFAAYLADTAPETALKLYADARAFLNLAERNLALSQADASSQTATTAPAAKDPVQDRLRLWGEVARNLQDQRQNQKKPISEASAPATQDQAPREAARRWAEMAITNDPLSARPLSILGELAYASGDQAGVQKYLSAAARRSIRESGAVFWRLHQSYEGKDYAAAVASADALLRTRSQAGEHVMPVLVHMAQNPGARAELEKVLFANPPWRSRFIAALAQKANDSRAALDLLFALRTTDAPPSAQDLRNVINAQLGRKEYELAYYMWLQSLPPEQLASVGYLFNGSFEVTPSGLPFDWVIAEGPGVRIEIGDRPDQTGQRALIIEFGHGRVEFRGGVQQLTLLAPGTYEFKGKYRGELIGKRGLVWRIACADAPNAAIGESQMVMGMSQKWKDIAFTFTVPKANCRAQQVRLELDARMPSETMVSGSISYDELTIVRADSAGQPEGQGK